MIILFLFTLFLMRGDTFSEKVFDHYNIYLGLTSLLIFTLAIIIIKLDIFTAKVHGILMIIAFILTLINIFLIWDIIVYLLTHKPISASGWWHIVHIILGFSGVVAFFIAIVKGLAGFQNKRSGYIAYVLWVTNFLMGGILWGFDL